ETWFGFIKEKKDAQILVDACAANLLTPIRELSSSTSTLEIRSGSVIILQDTSTTPAQKTRWRDSFSWSSSRISGAFLLYRQVEPVSTPSKNHTV
ncbi:gluconate transport inducer 1/Pac2, partial [Chytriomyces cf. hyalinus JEL632]